MKQFLFPADVPGKDLQILPNSHGVPVSMLSNDSTAYVLYLGIMIPHRIPPRDSLIYSIPGSCF
jgi:hypothetical protein